MGRLLAIDYGKKRTGIAVSDPLKIIATALDTIESKTLIPFLKAYVQKESVELFVMGQPKTLRNEPSENAARVQTAYALIVKNFPNIPIVYVDERFTSQIAFQSMIDSGVKKQQRKDKAMVDQISACLILQSYMSAN
jgi:putative Holliday junction resolvase